MVVDDASNDYELGGGGDYEMLYSTFPDSGPQSRGMLQVALGEARETTKSRTATFFPSRRYHDPSSLEEIPRSTSPTGEAQLRGMSAAATKSWTANVPGATPRHHRQKIAMDDASNEDCGHVLNLDHIPQR